MNPSAIPIERTRDLCEQIRVADWDALTDALLDIGSIINGWYRPSSGLTTPEEDVLDDLLSALADRSTELAKRTSAPAVLWSDRPALSTSHLGDAFHLGDERVTWKPVSALWTAPLLQDGSTAWIRRVRRFGDGLVHQHLIVIDRPSLDEVVVLGDLATALQLAPDRTALRDALSHLPSQGIAAIDFTWRCAIEAEVAAMRGDLRPQDFPCGLSTECTLWLREPSHSLALPQ